MADGVEDFEDCYHCEHVYGKSTDGEVWYDKSGLWLCLNCHVAERKVQKGKGTVKRILQECGSCHGESSDCTPAWFCYDCHQYLCSACMQGHDKQHVS